MSLSLSAFTSQFSGVEIPKDVQEVLSSPKWKGAVIEEMRDLKKNGTWEVVNLPAGKTNVFTVKYNSYGTLEIYKAWIVSKGFTQIYGIDYTETFTPVAKVNIVRVLLSTAPNLDWPL